tara:strand:+ start:1521 stop:1919 length:399 start_codon:yes stop_codon:yes gene_type:complete
MDILGIGKMVAGVVNGFGERKLRKKELEQAIHVKQLEGVQAIDAGEQAVKLGQMAINRQEAAHKSIFVAGWRPFIGWVCGIGLLYNVLLNPILSVWVTMPSVDPAQLYPVLMGMLGLGSLRTVEKIKKVESN